MKGVQFPGVTGHLHGDDAERANGLRPLISSANKSNISGAFLSSLQEQMTRARDGRVLALGPTRYHGDHDDDDGVRDGDGSGRSILDGPAIDDRS